MQEKKEFKDRLREAMAANNLKAVDLCERTGIPKSAVSYYLSGKSTPKSDRLYLIGRALDVSEAWLLGYDVPKERDNAQKKNDKLAQLVMRMRRDEAFFNAVSKLSDLSDDSFNHMCGLLSALGQK